MMPWPYTASLFCSAVPAVLTCWNLLLYRTPAQAGKNQLRTCSVVIPARNEEEAIAQCVRSVLASRDVEIECIVMDDGSTDATRSICEQIAADDARLVVRNVPSVPTGWNGKQYACWRGARQAGMANLLFLDADVRVAPDAIGRMIAFREASSCELVSGVPRQVTGGLMENLLLPLIHFVLLGYLPLAAMRRSSSPLWGAGCGQFLLVQRDAYFASGGHQKIKSTMHDGLKLPRVLREAGMQTDLADLTTLATCRMYRSAQEVWRGLGKNATEGLASAGNILPFSFLLLLGQVLPLALLLLAPTAATRWAAAVSVAFSFFPRALLAMRFRQSWIGVLLHPVDVALLLALRWWALLRKLAGVQPVWKQRTCNAG